MKQNKGKNSHHFAVTIEAVNRAGVMARISNVLRKFSLNIYEFHGKTHATNPDRFTMRLWMSGPRENCVYIFNKIDRLVDVVRIEWKRIPAKGTRIK